MEDQRAPQAREVDLTLHLTFIPAKVLCAARGAGLRQWQDRSLSPRGSAQVLSQLLATTVYLCVLGPGTFQPHQQL